VAANAVRDIDRPRTSASAGGIDVFTPDEVFALVRHADDETCWPRSPACARARSSRCAGDRKSTRLNSSHIL